MVVHPDDWVAACEDVMDRANIRGTHASPKGLRHGFGVAAVSSGVPLNLVQKWLGHAQLEMTATYADAMGAEAQALARRMWTKSESDIAAVESQGSVQKAAV